MNINWEMTGVLISAIALFSGMLAYLMNYFVNKGRNAEKLATMNKTLTKVVGDTERLETTLTKVVSDTERLETTLMRVVGDTGRLETTLMRVVGDTGRLETALMKVVGDTGRLETTLMKVVGDLAKIKLKFKQLPRKEYTSDLENVKVWIMKKDKSMIETFSAKHSPRRLTEMGEKVLNESGGKRCIDENLNFFMSELEKNHPRTPYDVEEQSQNVVMRNTRLKIFDDIKRYLYETPEVVKTEDGEEEISIFIIGHVMGIYLRDIYLKAHPDVK